MTEQSWETLTVTFLDLVMTDPKPTPGKIQKLLHWPTLTVFPSTFTGFSGDPAQQTLLIHEEDYSYPQMCLHKGNGTGMPLPCRSGCGLAEERQSCMAARPAGLRR